MSSTIRGGYYFGSKLPYFVVMNFVEGLHLKNLERRLNTTALFLFMFFYYEINCVSDFRNFDQNF